MSKIDYIQKIQECISTLKNNIDENEKIFSDFNTLKDEIDEFKVKVLIVGEFSAGKTALINCLLDDDILPEDITPETALATEIVYGEEPAIMLVNKDKNVEKCSLDEISKYDPQKYLKYIYTLPNDNLTKLKDYVLVDMPGFNSGIEAHNKAIMQYIEEGTVYFFVIDASNGTLSKSAINFLSEIKHYSNNLSFILTKSDKLTSENLSKITEHIKDVIYSETARQEQLTITSKYAEDTGTKLINLIQSFRPAEMLKSKYNGTLLFLINKALNILQTQLDALYFNPHDIDLQILKQEKIKKSLEKELENKKTDLEYKLQHNTLNNIMSEMQDGLLQNIDVLVENVKINNEAFNESVNRIIRPILVNSLKRNIDGSFNEFINDLENSLASKSNINITETINTIQNSVNAIQKIAKLGADFAKIKKYTTMYKIFSTGLAVTTSIVAPWLELVIIFLPDILSGINKLFGNSQDEQLRQQLQMEVIPSICEKLRPEIKQTLSEIAIEMFQDLEDEYSTIVAEQVSSLEKLKAEKQYESIDIESKRTKLNNSIRELNDISADLKTDMNN